MHQLSLLDASFLYVESAHMPMNIGAVQHFDVPADRRLNFYQDLKQYMRDIVRSVPFMQAKLTRTPLGIDQPVWAEDPDFKLENHLQKIDLSAPGNTHQLEILVAELHAQPLRRDRPLWKYYWIEGLKNGRGVLYSKYHHACMDGMGAQLILNTILSPSVEPVPQQLPQKLARAAVRPHRMPLLRAAAANILSKPLDSNHSLREGLNSTLKLGRRIIQGPGGLGAFAGAAPRTPFNRTISRHRAWAGCSLPLDAMKTLGQEQKASVNDVLMAVVAGALRRYLIREGALPKKTLTAGVPVSLRSSDDGGMNNHVTMLLCALGTQVKDPLKRLQLIKESMHTAKDLLDDASGLMLQDAHIPGLSRLLKNAAWMYDTLKLADFFGPLMNVVISNVRGPAQPMYLNGALMLSHYPVSIPAHSVAVNFTVQSYLNRLDLGITACARALPDIDELRDDVLHSWQRLLAAAVADKTPSSTGSGQGRQ